MVIRHGIKPVRCTGKLTWLCCCCCIFYIRDSGVSGSMSYSSTPVPGVVEGSTAAQADSPKSLLMSAPSSQPPVLSSVGSGSNVSSLATLSLSLDEEVDDDLPQLEMGSTGSSTDGDRRRGVATMPPSWRSTPRARSGYSSSNGGSSSSSRQLFPPEGGSGNGSSQTQLHPQPAVANDIVPLKSKLSVLPSASERAAHAAEQEAKVQ